MNSTKQRNLELLAEQYIPYLFLYNEAPSCIGREETSETFLTYTFDDSLFTDVSDYIGAIANASLLQARQDIVGYYRLGRIQTKIVGNNITVLVWYTPVDLAAFQG